MSMDGPMGYSYRGYTSWPNLAFSYVSLISGMNVGSGRVVAYQLPSFACLWVDALGGIDDRRMNCACENEEDLRNFSGLASNFQS